MGSTLLTPLYVVYRETFAFSELTLTLIYATYVIGNLSALFLFGRLSVAVAALVAEPRQTRGARGTDSIAISMGATTRRERCLSEYRILTGGASSCAGLLP